MEESRFAELQNGIVLAELGGHGDGPYCAEHAAGAALAIMGTYIVDPGDDVPYPSPFVFKPGRDSYAAYLRKHVAAARAGVRAVGVSVISVALEDTLDFLRAAEEAGADYAALCVYSAMDMFTREGLGVALCDPANRVLLHRWSSAIAQAVTIPVIFKIGLDALDETIGTVETISSGGVPIVHVAIGSSEAGSSDLMALGELAGRCEFLIAGGGVADVDGARRVLGAGAGAVAIATAAMKDPTLCGRIQQELGRRPAAQDDLKRRRSGH